MEKKLLLPTDFSKNSWNAIQYAIKLYENHNCDFYILHTYSKEIHGRDYGTLLDPDETFNAYSEKRSKQGLGEILIKLTFENENPKHRFHVLSRSTLFIDAVNDIVENTRIDMIIMGAKGMNDEHKDSYGQNTLSVIENIRMCPVLVVPKNVSFEMPEEIVLTTDFKTNFKSREIKYLAEIAKLSNANVQILSLTDNGNLSLRQKTNKLRLQKHLKGVDHHFNVLRNVKMATALSCFVEIRHSNMISYIDKKPSLWEQLGFGKRTLSTLGYFKDVPVLALHGSGLKK